MTDPLLLSREEARSLGLLAPIKGHALIFLQHAPLSRRLTRPHQLAANERHNEALIAERRLDLLLADQDDLEPQPSPWSDAA